ncbi:MAG: hypothetical protein ACKOXR_09440 [Bacteroidota bacterium]
MLDSTYKINPFPPNFMQWVDEVYKNRDNLSYISVKRRQEWGEWATYLGNLHSIAGKMAKKLPHHTSMGCLADARSLEQSTSESVSRWKAQQFPAGRLLSLTGGLGVDDWAWAMSGAQVESLDPNQSLNAWVRYNATRLGINPQRIDGTAEDFLLALAKTNPAIGRGGPGLYDLVYVDPDRRPRGQRTTVDVSEYLPNVFGLIEEYPGLGKSWLVKVSPMVDPTWLQRQFKCRADIYAVGLNGETKELLAHVQPGQAAEEGICDAFCLVEQMDATGNMVVESHRFSERSATISGEVVADIGKPGYIFEPAAPLFASHLHTQIPQRWNLLAATPNHNFFVAQAPEAAAFGRSLKVQCQFLGSLRDIQRQLKEILPPAKNKKALPQLNVTARNCGMTTDAVKKLLQVSDGGNQYLFIAKNDAQFIAWLGEIER